jgi:hypothetical protein
VLRVVATTEEGGVGTGGILFAVTEPRTLGAIALVLVAAAAISVVVHRWLSPHRDALAFSFLAACAFVGLLSWLGVEAASAIVWVMIGVLVVVWIGTAVLNS